MLREFKALDLQKVNGNNYSTRDNVGMDWDLGRILLKRVVNKCFGHHS